MTQTGFSNPQVETVFNTYSEPTRAKLLLLRQMIFDTAAATAGVGALEETLKWGQPSYLTSASKSGSTIRLSEVRADQGTYALYFNCKTTLVDTFRQLYPDAFAYEGNRSIVFTTTDEIPVTELTECLALALTYHRHKRMTPR